MSHDPGLTHAKRGVLVAGSGHQWRNEIFDYRGVERSRHVGQLGIFCGAKLVDDLKVDQDRNFLQPLSAANENLFDPFEYSLGPAGPIDFVAPERVVSESEQRVCDVSVEPLDP